MKRVATGALLVIALALSGAAVADQVKLDVSKRDPQCVRQCTAQYAECSPKQLSGPVASTNLAISACKEVFVICLQSCPENKKGKK